MPKRQSVLAMILAGGEGKRLYPLTSDRTKPAVPFGGHYRLIDFVLSNIANAGFLHIVVLTQYKSHSLNRHLALAWRLSPALGNYVTPVPAQMRRGKRWFAGSADAIYQNLNIITDEQPEHVLVFGADHLYRMDPGQMLRQHIRSGAGVTVAGIRVPTAQASAFGVIEAERDGKIVNFLEKPENPPSLADDPTMSFASMGNYIFRADVLREVVTIDAADEGSNHDIGGNIIPALVATGSAYVYDFAKNAVPGQDEQERGYWRDVGTLDQYYDAHMDLLAVNPSFSLYNEAWPIYTHHPQLPPAKTVHDAPSRTGMAVNSLLANGVIVSGGTVRHSVLSTLARVHSHALVEDSILLDSVDIGANAVVRRAIIDKGVRIPEGARIGVNLDSDRERFTVSTNGVVVIGKGEKVS